jgi:two-component system LytT family sensor kinase
MGKKLLNWYSTYKIHVLAWIFYMLYETLSIGIVYDNFVSPIIYLSHYLVFICFFYLHAHTFLPFALKNKRIAFWTVPIIVVLEVVAYVISQYIVSSLLIFLGMSNDPLAINSNFFIRNSYRAMFYMGFSTGYYFLRNYLNERKIIEELEKERLNAIIAQQKIAQQLAVAQNAFLKAQINPHFLFNTLDFIYHHVNIHSSVAGEAIIRLSDMMRFAIETDHTDSHINISDEIAQVENLLYLHKIRKDNQFNIEFSFTPSVLSLRFIPLVLLTLVENILKHGDLTTADATAIISLYTENDFFYIQTSNAIQTTRCTKSNNSGLNNVRIRLLHAYGEEITFDNGTREDNYFFVKLSVPLKFL